MSISLEMVVAATLFALVLGYLFTEVISTDSPEQNLPSTDKSHNPSSDDYWASFKHFYS